MSKGTIGRKSKGTIGRKNGTADALTVCERQLRDESSGYSVIFEDDGKVAYAYLVNPIGEIVADVWMYNRCESPDNPEWYSSENMPFANPKAYVREDLELRRIENANDVSVKWCDSQLGIAKIYLHGTLFAVLSADQNPGQCIMAKKDGPLAKMLITK